MVKQGAGIALVWRCVQILLGAAGLALWIFLFVEPDLGLLLLWNVLIPVAPALLAFAPGLWRNVCPLGSASLLPHHLGISRRRGLAGRSSRRLFFAAIMLLAILVPYRHIAMDTSAEASAVVLAALGIAALGMGAVFDAKSGWCASLCPVHPVERLYGGAPIATFPNAHCGSCRLCTRVCPESTPDACAVAAAQPGATGGLMRLMAGAFPGFVWGWFQVPDYTGSTGWAHLDLVYGVPLAAGAASWAAFQILLWVLGPSRRRLLIRAFAALAIGTYYWYRVPLLFGFREAAIEGVLIDLSSVLPAWFPTVSKISTSLLFAAWFVGRTQAGRPWTLRPALAGHPPAPAVAPLSASRESRV